MRSSRSVLAQRREPAPPKVIRLFQSETAEILEAPEPLRARMALFVLAGMFVALVVLAALLPIDRVVSSVSGRIVTAQRPVVIQALDPSIIRTIDVHEGEIVKKGQLLATLDPTFAAADVKSLRLKVASLNAEIARCRAELAQQPFTPPRSPLPGAERFEVLQEALYQHRKAQFEAQVNSYDQQIAQLEAAVAKYRDDAKRYSERARISQEIEHMRQTLAKDQVGSRLNLLAAIDNHYEMLRNIEFDQNTLLETEHQLKATMANRDAFIQQWYGSASYELVTARNSRDSAQQDLAKAVAHKALVQLRAPAAGMVLELQKVQVGANVQKISIGSVLTQGETFATLAPLDSPVEAELDIAAPEIGFIRRGDRTTIKLSAFNYEEHGTARGRVRWISDGAFTLRPDGQPAPPYYKVRVTLTRVKLKDVPKDFRLIPGMTLTGDIHIGTHSLLMYLFSNFAGLTEAMREP